ncbi:hypothetical protein ACLK1U_19175 [Escherichia coli]
MVAGTSAGSELALVSINPQNGAVMALVGGFDFNQSKFNRATQALRQVGSTSNRSSTPRRWIKV